MNCSICWQYRASPRSFAERPPPPLINDESQSCWILQASARQRKGRAGRVRKGKCYSLFTRHCHDTRMQAFQVPEIMRVPLEELVLQIHLLELGSAAEFLPELLQPPPQKAVDAAVSSLQTIGVLCTTSLHYSGILKAVCCIQLSCCLASSSSSKATPSALHADY